MSGVKGRSGVYKRTHPIWNKGIKRWWNSPTEFKKGEHLGEKHWAWKADKVSYSGLHKWIRSKLGNPTVCSRCKKTEGRIEWASLLHHATRDLTDYIQLCVTCHRWYDRKVRI